MCFQLPILHVSNRLAGSSLVMTSGILLALAFGGLLITVAWPFLLAAVTLLACAQMLVEPLTQALVSGLAPANARATYMAAMSVVNDLKDAVGPAVGTCLYAASVWLPWTVGMPVTLTAAVALSLAVHRQEAVTRKNGDGGSLVRPG